MNRASTLTLPQLLVLEHLKRVGACSAKQIARSLHVTPMAVRHHLAVLEKAGWLATTLDRSGSGRPSYLYALTERAEAFFPNEYGDLANRLLRNLAQLDGEAKVVQLFEQMKKTAVVHYTPHMVGKELRDRVAAMAKIQGESGYMADWRQVDDDTFELTEHNCAIWQVARICPAACDCELALMQELLGAQVSRTEHIVKGDACCRYLIEGISRAAGKKHRRRCVG
ncbi:MAG: helix-turn-helix transcriptional regulator [Terriglobia bacterium]